MSRFSEVMLKANQLQQQLASEGYDEADILMSVESETDLLRILDRVVESTVKDERFAASARERAKRLEARADQRKAFISYMMGVIEVDKIERPLATLWHQNNPPALQLDGEVPEAYQTLQPDKDMIRKALRDGIEVPNARLTQTRSLRMKVT